jgi:hypothetical protein
MPSAIVDIDKIRKDLTDEEYEECKEWVREISLIGCKEPDKPIDIKEFASFSGPEFDAVVAVLKKTNASRCIRSAGKKYLISFQGLEHLIKSANNLLSPVGGRFLTLPCLLFLLAMAAYTVEQDKYNGHMELLKNLKGGEVVDDFHRFYIKGGEGEKMYVGIVSKLMGIAKPSGTMECPRVWDLVEDEIIPNPNLNLDEKFHPIVAISHRWTKGEATYADIVQKGFRESLRTTNTGIKLNGVSSMGAMSVKTPSLTKLRVLKNELTSYGIRYVWMDTICIDKTSSAETDEAIRSMYKWYSGASFVYLESDTTIKDWITRGWTLQEGVAAKALRLHSDRGGCFLEAMCREHLEDDDYRAMALEAPYMPTNSMYWIFLMNKRNTTKLEDKAYALIGLLGLDFQAAYGEGKRSMSRLCDELTRQKRDVSWLLRDNYRNGNWTTSSYQIRDGKAYLLTMQEVCYRKNLVVSYDEIQIVGPALKLSAIQVSGGCLDDLKLAKIYSSISYKATFIIAPTCEASLDKIGSKITYWWVPSNNIIFQLCKYRTKANPGKFWRIICVRGAPDNWTPPSAKPEEIVVDYDTIVYEPDHELEEIVPEPEKEDSRGKPEE